MQSFDINELLIKFRYPLLIFLSGLILVTSGVFVFKSGVFSQGTKVEVLNAVTETGDKEITAEITGAVVTPGVYKMKTDARINDLIVIAGGVSSDADRVWMDKYLNRAAKLTDGQKVYIPEVDEQSNTLSAKTDGGNQTVSQVNSSDSNGFINVNTASLAQLDSLPGIGQVYAQNIVEHRPYSTTEELVSKGAIKQNVYEKIKDKVSIY